MGKVAIAGATSQLGHIVLDKLVSTKKHDILVLGRGDPASQNEMPGVTRKQTSFNNHSELVDLLSGYHTLLCFWDPTKDPGAKTQKGLVDAAIEAGVQRYAPSEWSTGAKLAESLDVFPFYADKISMREYLREINKNKKVIEYTLFQNGIFMDYLGYPRAITDHLSLMATLVMFSENRVIGLKECLDNMLTFTSVQDIAGVVAAAVEYEDEWPQVGGISGDRISLKQVQEIGEAIKGSPFTVDLLDKADVEAGEIKLDPMPPIIHPSIPDEQKPKFAKLALQGLLLSAERGAWTVTDEWNQLLPNYKFTSVRDFAKAWIEMQGK